MAYGMAQQSVSQQISKLAAKARRNGEASAAAAAWRIKSGGYHGGMKIISDARRGKRKRETATICALKTVRFFLHAPCFLCW